MPVVSFISNSEYIHYLMVKKLNSMLFLKTSYSIKHDSINSVKENNKHNKKQQKKNEKAIKQKQQNQVK